jgi:hypothetical protein
MGVLALPVMTTVTVLFTGVILIKEDDFQLSFESYSVRKTYQMKES